MHDFPFVDVRSSSGKSCVVSGPSCMAAMISNKRYNPGDRVVVTSGETTSDLINVNVV